jgi:hypothetical protein
MGNTEKYEHMPLPGEHYIRLLQLHHVVDDNEAITGTLETHRLTDKIVPYTTLSYSWAREDGSDDFSREVLLHGRRLDITENLYDALFRLRQGGKGKCGGGQIATLFWVDAICINQANVPERNTQVAMMARIFDHGTNMVIWLGEDNRSCDDQWAFEALRTCLDHPMGSTQPCGQRNESKEAFGFVRSDLGLSVMHFSALQMAYVLDSQVLTSFYLANLQLSSPSSETNSADEHADQSPSTDVKAWASRFLKNLAVKLVSDIDFAKGILAASLRNASISTRSLFLSHRTRNMADVWPGHGDHPLDVMTKAVSNLVSRRYFSRRWVLQERFHSFRQPTFVCWNRYGFEIQDFVEAVEHYGETLNWDLIGELQGLKPTDSSNQAKASTASSGVANSRYTLKAAWSKAHRILQLEQTDPRRELEPGITIEISISTPWKRLMRALDAYHDLSCSDERDRLYALLSLSGRALTVGPDYQLDTDTMCVRFAEGVLMTGLLPQLLVLAACQRSEEVFKAHGSVSAGLPSWVPDLRLPILYSRCSRYSIYNRESVSLDGHVLRFEALLLDASDFLYREAEAEYDWVDFRLRGHRMPLSGEMLCSIDGEYSLSVLVLRPIKGSEQSYELVGLGTFVGTGSFTTVFGSSYTLKTISLH